MKRSISLAAFAALSLLLAGCGGSNAASSPAPASPETSSSQGRKAIVVYFSYPENTELPAGMDAAASMSVTKEGGGIVGNTAVIARMIASHTGADLFSVVTERKYPANYNDTVSIGKDEQNENARPALASRLDTLAEYDTVFLGYPNWWGDMPMAMYTFLDMYDLSGKTIIPFATSGGSGLSRTVSSIRSAEPSADVKEGLAVYQTDVAQADTVVANWLSKLGY